MRTIPAEQLEDLAELCRRDGISRAEAIRQAVASHVRRARAQLAFGMWRDRAVDSLTLQRRLRDEWTAAARPKSRSRRAR